MTTTKAQVVGFDMDGVMAHTNDILAEGLSKILGRPIDWRDWNSYDYFKNYGLGLDEFLEMCIHCKSLELAEPEPGLKSSIERLTDEGLETAIITARDFHPQGEHLTRQWLECHGVKVDHLMLVHPSNSKVQAMSSMPNMLSYIDDHVDHLIRGRESGHEAKLYMRDQPWNQHCSDFSRVHSIDQYVQQVLDDRAAATAKSKFRPR